MHLRLGTRGSALATTQSQHIADALTAVASERGIDAQVDLEIVTTHGDVSRTSLVGLSTTGVFVNALRDHLLAGDCDLLVHSLKDIPVEPHPDLDIAAIPVREDVRDALCTRGTSLLTLPEGARIGTGSPRRAAQLRKARPDLEIVDIRGNVDTRLGRVGHDLDGAVLAAAGLSRLGRLHEATELIPVDVMVPAPGQGALAVEIRHDADPTLRELVKALDDPATRAAVVAERTALAVLEAGCSAPVGAHAVVDDGQLRLHLRVTNTAGTLQLNEIARGPMREAAAIGRAAGHSLLGRGAARLMGAR